MPGIYSDKDELVKHSKRHKAAQASSLGSYQKNSYLTWLSRFLLLALLACIGYAGREVLFNPGYFPLTQIKVNGEFHHLNPMFIQRLVTPYLQQGFFGVSTTSLQDELQQLPWINKVAVTRHWPAELEVTIFEQQPRAHWNGNALVTGQGEVFTPADANAQQNLPYFTGPLGKQVLMLKTYEDLQQLLQPLSLTIKQLYLTDRHAWQLQLGNGIIVNLGNQDVVARLKRFAQTYQQIFAENANKINYIDMRYSNGMAVKWLH